MALEVQNVCLLLPAQIRQGKKILSKYFPFHRYKSSFISPVYQTNTGKTHICCNRCVFCGLENPRPVLAAAHLKKKIKTSATMFCFILHWLSESAFRIIFCLYVKLFTGVFLRWTCSFLFLSILHFIQKAGRYRNVQKSPPWIIYETLTNILNYLLHHMTNCRK